MTRSLLSNFAMFQEKYLIGFSGGGHGGGHGSPDTGSLIKGIFSTEPGKRTDALNSVPNSTEHNEKMKKMMHEQLQTPLKDAVKGTREEIGKFGKIPGILKDGFKGTLKAASTLITKPIETIGNTSVNLLSGTAKVATHIATNPVGAVVNGVQTGVDWTAKLAMRPPLILIDNLASLLGRPSKWIKDFRDFTINRIESAAETIKKTCASIRDRALNAIGLGEGGHGHVAAHAAH